jgi:hypothetical protein
MKKQIWVGLRWDQARFEVREWYADIVCPKCSWKMDTLIRPKTVSVM